MQQVREKAGFFEGPWLCAAAMNELVGPAIFSLFLLDFLWCSYRRLKEKYLTVTSDAYYYKLAHFFDKCSSHYDTPAYNSGHLLKHDNVRKYLKSNESCFWI